MKYRKRPVVIEAEQWTGGNGLTIASFMGEPFLDDAHMTDTPIIHTLEGDILAKPGPYDAGDVARISAFATAAAAGVGATLDEDDEN